MPRYDTASNSEKDCRPKRNTGTLWRDCKLAMQNSQPENIYPCAILTVYWGILYIHSKGSPVID